MKIKIIVFWVTVLALALTACGSDTDSENTPSTVTNEVNTTITDETTDERTIEEESNLPVEQEAQNITEAEEADMDVGADAPDDGVSVGIVAPPPAVQAQTRSQFQPLPLASTPAPPADMTFQNPGTNPFLDTEDDNLSTFALDVDSASYTVARNYLLNQDIMPPEDAIRPEEFINYFDARYDSPTGDEAFGITINAVPAPFGFENHHLMRVGVQGRYIAPEDRDPVLLIFVIDVSGSMDMENRLGLVKQSLALLVDELREDDRVGIVVCSDNSRTVLEPTPASEKATIMDAINALQPEGSTNVEAGLNIGYTMAADNMRADENTRVIILSDGVGNVGATDPQVILDRIQDRADQGITLSAIGFGMGNYNDVMMEQIANDGNGNYYYVDEIGEARRVFVHNLTGTLQVIGYDAKIQVEFNPDVTDRYRLIGYENRAIADEDFRNDTVDAGEVGAGQSATALYELALEGSNDGAQRVSDDVIATVYVRYEDAETREIVEISQSITFGDLLESIEEAPASFQVQAAAAEFAEMLRGSFWAEDATYGDVLRLLNSAQDTDPALADDEALRTLEQMVRVAVRLGDQ